MQKVKLNKEVEAVQITMEEFIDITSTECTKVFLAMSDDDDDSAMNILVPMICAKFSAQLADRIFFNDKNEESEEN